MRRILSTLRVTVPSGRRKEVLDLLKFLIGPMCHQPGCLSCRAYQDIDNPNRLTLVEEWESHEDLENHIGSDDYMKQLSLMDISSEKPEIVFHTVSETRGMEVIIAVREQR